MPNRSGVEVVVLRWPEEAVRTEQLRRDGLPRLLLVAPSSEPPGDWDALTDWVRLPVDPRDVDARVAALRRRAGTPTPPRLDEFGVLWREAAWVDLTPTEARIIAALLAVIGTVVSRRELAAAGWPNGVPNERSLDGSVVRLRRRVAPMGIVIHTVRRRGLLLEVNDRRCGLRPVGHTSRATRNPRLPVVLSGSLALRADTR